MSYPSCPHDHNNPNLPCPLCLQEETREADRAYIQQLRDELEALTAAAKNDRIAILESAQHDRQHMWEYGNLVIRLILARPISSLIRANETSNEAMSRIIEDAAQSAAKDAMIADLVSLIRDIEADYNHEWPSETSGDKLHRLSIHRRATELLKRK